MENIYAKIDMGAFHVLYVIGSKFMTYPNMSEEGDVWMDGPTSEGMIIYSIITPMICVFAIVGNILSLMVLMRKQFKASVFVYLSVLAFTDLGSAILLLLGGLSRGVLYWDQWPIFDAAVGLPLGGMFNVSRVLATMALTFDRALLLSNPLACEKPKFCNSRVARNVMAVSFVIAVVSSIPYCFIFEWDPQGIMRTRKNFFYSKFYQCYNWFAFIAFGVFPAIFLTTGNGYLIWCLRKLKKIKAKCSASVRCGRKDYTSMTVILILIVFLFLLTEVPSLMLSRATAVTFFFGDSPNSPCNNLHLEVAREITTVVYAGGLAVEFLLYFMFCPEFYRALTRMCQRNPKRCKSIQMNVFVIGGNAGDENGQLVKQRVKALKKMAAQKILELIQDDNDSSYGPYSSMGNAYDPPMNNRTTLITLCPIP